MSTLSSVINSVREAVSGGKFKPAKLLPAALLICVSLRRTGMSAMDITSEWITELDKLHIPIGKNTDGTPNLITAAGYSLVKCITKSIKMSSLVSVAGTPGSITFTGVGENAGGPVVIKGANDSTFIIRGTVQ
jgi:hypothetical protein